MTRSCQELARDSKWTKAANADGEITFDAAGFERDIKAARDSVQPSQKEENEHLARIELWTTVLGLVGLALSVQGTLSIVSMVCLGYYRYRKFAILAHHTLHGGWGIHRRGWFAKGVYRRTVDWLDWILPEAWNVEHNKVHHYRLNEDADPDLVCRNTEIVRAFPDFPGLRYALVAVNAGVWKWAYYASNTLKILHAERPGAPPPEVLEKPMTINDLLLQIICVRSWSTFRWYMSFTFDFLTRVMGPPLVMNYVVVPMCAAWLAQFTGVDAWLAMKMCLFNMMGAELVTNVHAFATIVTNHAGDDLWHFSAPCKADSAEFYLRAILGSTAYHAGNDFVDYFHGYLNYQAEHHAFPALTPLHYQRLHKPFKAVCAKYGVPYVQEPVWARVKKTADIISGYTKLKPMPGNSVACDNPGAWMIDPCPDACSL